eukprot:g973.t1
MRFCRSKYMHRNKTCHKDQEQPTKKAKISQEDFNDHAISDEEWDLSQKVAKLEQDVQNVNDKISARNIAVVRKSHGNRDSQNHG